MVTHAWVLTLPKRLQDQIEPKIDSWTKWLEPSDAAELCPRPYGAMKPPPTLGARETTVVRSLYSWVVLERKEGGAGGAE